MAAYQKIVFPDLDPAKLVKRSSEEKNFLEVKNLQVIREQLTQNSLSESTQTQPMPTGLKLEDSSDIISNLDIETSEVPANQVSEEIQASLAAAKLEGFSEGYDSAKKEYAEQLEELNKKLNLKSGFDSKINVIEYNYDNYENQVVDAAINIIQICLDKLSKKLPTDFAGLVSSRLINLLKNYRNESSIIIRSNSDRKDFIMEMLSSLPVTDDIRQSLKVETDNNLTTDDCEIQCKDAKLEFKQEEIAKEIANILANITI